MSNESRETIGGWLSILGIFALFACATAGQTIFSVGPRCPVCREMTSAIQHNTGDSFYHCERCAQEAQAARAGTLASLPPISTPDGFGWALAWTASATAFFAGLIIFHWGADKKGGAS